MPNRDRQSIEDMLRAARKILEYARGASRETLPTVPMRLDAVLYEIVVLGEAARRLSPDLRERHPGVPWRDIIGMRSVVTHGYDQIDDDELMASHRPRSPRTDLQAGKHPGHALTPVRLFRSHSSLFDQGRCGNRPYRQTDARDHGRGTPHTAPPRTGDNLRLPRRQG